MCLGTEFDEISKKYRLILCSYRNSRASFVTFRLLWIWLLMKEAIFGRIQRLPGWLRKSRSRVLWVLSRTIARCDRNFPGCIIWWMLVEPVVILRAWRPWGCGPREKGLRRWNWLKQKCYKARWICESSYFIETRGCNYHCKDSYLVKLEEIYNAVIKLKKKRFFFSS